MSSSSGSTKRFPNGSIKTELFRYPTTTTLLLDYELVQSVKPLSSGVFVMNLFMQMVSPIITATCTINEFQWPLTKDTPVIRIGKHTFVFCIPGVVFAFQFTRVTEEVTNQKGLVSLSFATTIAPPEPLVCQQQQKSLQKPSPQEHFYQLTSPFREEAPMTTTSGMLPSIRTHMQRLRSTHDPPACNKIWKLNEIGLEAFLKGLDSTSDQHEADDEVVLLPVPPTYKGKGKEKVNTLDFVDVNERRRSKRSR
ncbi:hypothetical protein G2W53_008215 [Senna tora]|uniref:Uncharacterized protein n=1 Tax=Senna tora TaxID=362788 RepID=A0A834X8D3_9FABA|nr:hypothetical protein G2W53_008215 [Senna tora]